MAKPTPIPESISRPAAACPEVTAAPYLGMSLSALRKARYRGDIPAIVYNGRKVTYLYSDLDAYLAKHRHTGGKDRAVGQCGVWRAKRASRPQSSPTTNKLPSPIAPIDAPPTPQV